MKEQRLRNGRDHLLALAVLLLCLLAMTGCGGGGGSSGDGGGGGSPGTPTIALLPSADVNFGSVVLDSSSFRSITVQNTGTANLVIGQITQPAPPFTILPSSNCSGFTLLPSQSCSLNMQFSPTSEQATPLTGSFTIPSNDSQNNPVAVSLSGTARGLKVTINDVQTDLCGGAPKKLKVLVSVTDKTGALVPDLEKTGIFNLIETVNGNPPSQYSNQPPASINVTPVTVQQGLAVALAMDYSSSTKPYTSPVNPQLETATLYFLDLLNYANDEAQIIKFDKNVYDTVRPFTSDKNALVAGVNEAFPDPNRSGTALYDAVLKSVEDTVVRTKSSLGVIVITDGNDTESAKTIDQVIQEIGTSVPVYTIGLGDDQNVDVLTKLADKTGGSYYPSTDPSQLQDIYFNILGGLTSNYVIEYPTLSTGGAPISLDLTVVAGSSIGEDSYDAASGCP